MNQSVVWTEISDDRSQGGLEGALIVLCLCLLRMLQTYCTTLAPDLIAAKCPECHKGSAKDYSVHVLQTEDYKCRQMSSLS